MPKVAIPSQRMGAAEGNVWQWVDDVASTSKTKPMTHMGTGYLEFKPPEFLIKAYQDSFDTVSVNQYGPMLGRPNFKKAVAEEYSSLFNRKIDPQDEVLVSTGASEGVFSIIHAFISPGDEVIIIEPYFNMYYFHIKFAHGILKAVPLRPPSTTFETSSANGWTLDMEELSQAITDKTKLLILNNPHNPLGKIWSETELRQIGNLCLERGVTILSDEVYERVHYTPSFSRIATLSDDFWKITLTVSSIGKMFNATGWRLGFVIGPSNLIKTLQWAHIIVSYVTAGPVQEAAARGFKLAHDYGFWQQNKDFMRRKMDAFCDGLRDIGLPFVEPSAAYFVFVNTKKIRLPSAVEDAAELKDKPRDYKVAWFLIHNFGIVSIPGSGFYYEDRNNDAPNFLRFTVCKTDETIRDVKRRLQQLRPHIVGNSQAAIRPKL